MSFQCPRLKSLAIHLRQSHPKVQLLPAAEEKLDLRKCPYCFLYYLRRGISKHSGTCVSKRPPPSPPRSEVSDQAEAQAAQIPQDAKGPDSDRSEGA